MAAINHSEIFILAVQQSFKHWPILRIAKQQGFGGRNADEKEGWLCESVIQIFQDNGMSILFVGCYAKFIFSKYTLFVFSNVIALRVFLASVVIYCSSFI